MTRAFRFDSSDGYSLEAELDSPDSPRAALVLCHPHPKMGGTMNAPLLLAVRDELREADWAVLRFNFRGIGASHGRPSTGIAEVADAAGAVAEAQRRLPDVPIAIAGWSFGGAIALRAASQHPDLVACVTIAPALRPKPDITAGAPSPSGFGYRGPTLLICGSNDDQVAPSDCRDWAREAGASFEEIKGANHFFWAKYEPLTARVRVFLENALESGPHAP